MSQVIRISRDLYKRLESHAQGFDTPSNIIERLLNFYESTNEPILKSESSNKQIEHATELEIVYLSDDEDAFKEKLLSRKKAYIKLHYTNGQSEVKEWNAVRFNERSQVDGNLRSGRLRGWKEKGIYKAELSVNRNDFAH